VALKRTFDLTVCLCVESVLLNVETTVISIFLDTASLILK
jgi:hypothetical protein